MYVLMQTLTAALVASSAAFAQSAEASLSLAKRATKAKPIMNGQNFPDPAIIRVADGWYAFSTNAMVDGKRIHVQMANSPNFKDWKFRSGVDALPKLPAWVDANSPRVWAPDVVRLGDGSFIMYYTAALKSQTNLHCLSYATSRNVDGPYTDSTTSPWICPTGQGGAIDPAGYYNSDNTRWVTYKIDGNAIGHGGECGNTVAPIVPTPLMLQQVSVADGRTKIGAPIQILTNGPADGPYVEAPSLSKLGGKFILLFSSQCFATTRYDVSYALASNIKGPYVKYGPLFITGTAGMTAPGGLDIAVNGDHAIWHGNHGSGRAAYTAILSLKGNVLSAAAIS